MKVTRAQRLTLTAIFFFLLSAGPVCAAGLLDRFEDEEKGHITFIEKGHYAWGISGSYHILDIQGASNGDGYRFLSILNLGEGRLQHWSVSPSFSYMPADDFAVGIRLDYDGYIADADLNLDLRNVLSDEDSYYQLTSKHIVSHKWGASFFGRKYLSFFGSRLFGLFGEGRLYGNFGMSTSEPLHSTSNSVTTDTITVSTGLKAAAGAVVKLRDNSAITLSIPLVSIGYLWSRQEADLGVTTNTAYINKFDVSRDVDILSIQVGYQRYIK